MEEDTRGMGGRGTTPPSNTRSLSRRLPICIWHQVRGFRLEILLQLQPSIKANFMPLHGILPTGFWSL